MSSYWLSYIIMLKSSMKPRQALESKLTIHINNKQGGKGRMCDTSLDIERDRLPGRSGTVELCEQCIAGIVISSSTNIRIMKMPSSILSGIA